MFRTQFLFVAILSIICSLSCYGKPLNSRWVESQYKVAKKKLLENISPRDAKNGAVIASPSRHSPNYYFHWIRDAALVMDVVLGLYERSTDPAEKSQLMTILKDFVFFSLRNQELSGSDKLGEPKYHVDGRPYTGPWGRPQNDGPGLRAAVMIRLANTLLDQGDTQFVKKYLYASALPAITAIKRDLEYVAKNWRYDSFDLWEEIRGHHFYTKMAQYRALQNGAKLASRLNDPHAAKFYKLNAMQLKGTIDSHFHAKRQQIIENLSRTEGINYKNSGLDAATVLAINHNFSTYQLTAAQHKILVSTAGKIEASFKRIYHINNANQYKFVQPAIGRYPEDAYYGGNPWFLTTLGFAEFYFDLYRKTKKKDHMLKAEGFLARVYLHRNGSTGQLDEQFSRHNGYMLSARDLTWSYASFITAIWARQRAQTLLTSSK